MFRDIDTNIKFFFFKGFSLISQSFFNIYKKTFSPLKLQSFAKECYAYISVTIAQWGKYKAFEKD